MSALIPIPDFPCGDGEKDYRDSLIHVLVCLMIAA